ncbi:MAG: type II toxin-antitoxin system HipA family toxin [Pseudomonadota bacterium]
MSELRVLIDENEVGTISQGQSGRLKFVYDDAWRNTVDAVPLSLSMPLAQRTYPHKTVSAYLWNLLPDREDTLRQIAAEHGVSARNPFALAGARGEDLPGAVQIVPPERIPDLKRREGVNRISEADLGRLLRNLQRASGVTHIGEDSGFFSLAGAQPKVAACLVNDRWYEQRGRTPSTHIIKPAMLDLDAQVENEHFCLRLAKAVGLNSVKSSVRSINDLQTIVVERYDRVRLKNNTRLRLDRSGGRVFRFHQEDMCSALSVLPENKYQSLGGPGMKPVMQLLEGSSSAEVDRERFMRACAFNFVIAGTDAHGKNYSVLMDAGGRFRLAPLYDIISALPYDPETYNSLAMSVGGERKLRKITPRHWQKAAAECRYDPQKALAHVRDYAAHAPVAATELLGACNQEGLRVAVLRRLVDSLSKRSEKLLAEFQ